MIINSHRRSCQTIVCLALSWTLTAWTRIHLVSCVLTKNKPCLFHQSTGKKQRRLNPHPGSWARLSCWLIKLALRFPFLPPSLLNGRVLCGHYFSSPIFQSSLTVCTSLGCSDTPSAPLATFFLLPHNRCSNFLFTSKPPLPKHH